MTNANESAYGYGYCTADGSNNQDIKGLSKREYFAAMRRPQEGDSTISKAVAEAIMGETAPTEFDLDSLKWWVAAEEKLAVLHADALINALNETK